jgi:chemotaxis protein CheD
VALERVAKIGELVISAPTEDVVLSALGLGSCIGLVIVAGRSAGLAHILLPTGKREQGDPPAKYADTAVPALVDALIAAGAARSRMEAAIVGGAKMFSFGNGSGPEIGARNEHAVRDQLATARIPIVASAAGGQTGRSVRVEPGLGLVEVKEAGARRVVLYQSLRGKVAA